MTASKPTLAYPTRTKIIVPIVLAVAIGGFVLAGLQTDTDPTDTVAVSGTDATAGQIASDPDGVISVSPRDDAQALAQEEVRIRLSPTWTGELTLLPSSGAALHLPDDEVETTALNELVFQPGPGKSVERLPSGRSCVRATIWDQVRGRDASERVETWCFDVT